jgi:tRNA dimethylallyltransferase
MKLIVICGPTATGKTSLAAHLAYRLDAEIISGDSRQVYRRMDIGTGKDLDDYWVYNTAIPFHLIDIVDAGYEYNLFEYQRDFLKAYSDIKSRNKQAVLCGGSGLYISAVLQGYHLLPVPPDKELRKSLMLKSDEELIQILSKHVDLHNKTDTENRKRLVRAVEIALHYESHCENIPTFPKIDHVVFGIHFERTEIRQRITERLKNRLQNGMSDEIITLLNSGLSPEKLKYYGLEYKYLTAYVTGECSYQEMFERLNTAIHQFAKRQMTWFRKMEKEGLKITWIDGKLPMEKKLDLIMDRL